MNTIELVNILSHNRITKKAFRGVYSSDLLPKHKLKKPCIVIANTDPSTLPGTHWSAFYFPKNVDKKERRRGEFFCSFGSPPLSPEFQHFVERNCKSFMFNNRQLQGNFSEVCGQFSCVYLYSRLRGKTLKQFLRMFSRTDFELNDAKVIHLYRKYFKKSRKRFKTSNSNDVQDGGQNMPCIQKCKSRYNIC